MIPLDPSQKAPSKIAGIAYLLLGIFALFIACIVLVLGSTFGGFSDTVRYAFGGALLAYGIFRIVSGAKTIRKADEASRTVRLDGHGTP